MKKEIENRYIQFDKYFGYVFLIAVIIPNFVGPEWLIRLTSLMFSTIGFFVLLMGVFVKRFYLGWSREQVIAGKQRGEQLNDSQSKWSRGLYYFGVYLVTPFFLYMIHFPLVDLFGIVTQEDYVQSTEVTIADRSESMGTWYIGQILDLEEKNVSDGSLMLMFSLQHALRGEEYEVMYLPYSGLILELKSIR